jgi:DNA anti-recombination protein RmuC
MSDAAELTYELLKRLHDEFAEFRRELSSIKQRLGSIEQNYATMAADIARINVKLDDIRAGIIHIKTRLDLVDA